MIDKWVAIIGWGIFCSMITCGFAAGLGLNVVVVAIFTFICVAGFFLTNEDKN